MTVAASTISCYKQSIQIREILVNLLINDPHDGRGSAGTIYQTLLTVRLYRLGIPNVDSILGSNE